ncbi:MAG: hypothetical protein JO222_09100 [Frankiales bacterium]|nr:hypothetical protein [Frankiales bacterium]
MSDDNITAAAPASSLGAAVFTEPAAADPCGVLLHSGATGTWNCHRQRGHDGPCWATGTVTID